MTVIRKHGEWEEKTKKTKESRKKGNGNKPHQAPTIKQIPLKSSENYVLTQHGDTVSAIRREWESVANAAAKSLNVMVSGVTIGTQRGKSFVPDHALALSAELNRDAFPSVEVGVSEAISYLRRDNISLPASTPIGFVIITFRGIPLGFVRQPQQQSLSRGMENQEFAPRRTVPGNTRLLVRHDDRRTGCITKKTSIIKHQHYETIFRLAQPHTHRRT